MADPIQPVSYRSARALDFISAALVYAGIFLLNLLPLDWASALGGKAARLVGPHIKGVSRTARKNLKASFPEKSDAEIETILKEVWENMGRTGAEFALMDSVKRRVTTDGVENIRAAEATGKPIIFFGAHLGNWETVLLLGEVYNLRVNAFYRAPNNPLLLKLFASRSRNGELIPKGAAGARRAFALLKKGEPLGFLIDQKLNDGIAVPFFGRDAMTGTALAEFAMRFDSPVVPLQTIRENGANFRVIAHPPLTFEKTDDHEADVRAAMVQANLMVEGWVRERPGQWLWLHRRWPVE